MRRMWVTSDRLNDEPRAPALGHAALAVFFLLGFACAGNLNALSAGFVWDDRALVTGNVFIKHWSTLPALFQQPFLGMFYRPVVMVSLALDYALWGLRPFGFHLTNVLLHAANSILAFAVLRRVSRSNEVAFVAALLFAVHPAHKGVVAIADRTGVLSAFFFLSSLALYIRCRSSEHGGTSIIPLAGSWVLCGLGFFVKEEIIMLPVIVMMVDAFVFDEWLRPFRFSRIARYMPFLLLAVFYLWIRARVLGSAGGMIDAFAVEPVRRLLTVPAVLVDYFLLLLFPLHMDYGPRTTLVGSPLEPRILLSLLLVLLIAAAVPFLFKKKRTELFGLLWYLVVFFPMSNVIPIYAETAGSRLFTPIHFLYLPSIGLFLCVACALEAISQGFGRNGNRRRLRRAVSASLCLVMFLFSLLSLNRNFTWKDELTFYQYVVKMHPGNHRMLVNLGNVYLERGQVDAAVTELERAVLYAPDRAAYRNSLALAYKAKGWFDKAAQQFREGLRLDPNSGMMYINLASMCRENGRIREAIAFARKALELSPDSAAARVTLGLAYQDAGNLKEAEEQFKTALEVDPGCSDAHNSLGVLYAVQERYDLARQEWEQALRISPDMVEAYDNLQRLKRMGQ